MSARKLKARGSRNIFRWNQAALLAYGKTFRNAVEGGRNDRLSAGKSFQNDSGKGFCANLSVNQAIQFPLVELQTQAAMLRALIRQTAWEMDTYGAFSASDKVSMCNYWSNRMCCEAADRAMQTRRRQHRNPLPYRRPAQPPARRARANHAAS
jgi:hypothetical protein